MEDCGYSAKLLAHSISEAGFQLYTWEVTFPRIVLAELNTHRMLSRNSASSRAIPVEKMIRMVEENPYIPSSWGKNQKGMQAGEDVSEGEAERARSAWLGARDAAVIHARRMLDAGIHKQLTNRLLEPFMWHTAIVSATEVSNFFHLRDNPEAHPDLRRAAYLMKLCSAHSTPTEIVLQKTMGGAWHAPLVFEEDSEEVLHRDELAHDGKLDDGWYQRRWAELCKISVGRCARVSYLTHDGKRDLNEDIALHDRLLASGHMSPFEHVARPMTKEEMKAAHRVEVVFRRNTTGMLTVHRYSTTDDILVPHGYEMVDRRDTYFCGNFNGWMQYRKTLPFEHDVKNPKYEALCGPL